MTKSVVATLFERRATAEEYVASACQVLGSDPSPAERRGAETLERSARADIDDLDAEIRRLLTGDADPELRGLFGRPMGRSEVVEYTFDRRALSKLSSAAGGATAARDFVGMLGGALVDVAPLLELATVVHTVDGDVLDVPFVATNPTPPGIIAETAALTAVDPTFGIATLSAFKYPVLTKVSAEMALDGDFDLERYMADVVAPRIAALASADFYRGVGAPTAPQGLALALSTVAAGSPTSVAFADVEALLGAVPAAYRSSPRMAIVMSPGAYMQLRSQKGSTGGSYLWPVTDGNRLFGFPVFVDNALPSAASTNRTVIAGDIATAYVIRMVDLRVERSGSFDFASGLVNVRCVVRTDGRVMVSDACRALVH